MNNDTLLQIAYGDLEAMLDKMQDDGYRSVGCFSDLCLDSGKEIKLEIERGSIKVVSQPVKRVRWEYSEKEYGECAWYFCSCCDEPAEQLYNDDPLLSEFCPHCGARMDGDAE